MFDQLEIWGQFGLAGLVIAALFLVLYKGTQLVVNKIDKINQDNNEVIKRITDLHADERKAWRDEMTTHSDKLANALDNLSSNISEQTVQIRLNSGNANHSQ